MRKSVIIMIIFSLTGILHTNQVSGKPSPLIDFHIEMPPWEDVDEFLPRKSVFTVIDAETGKSFKVQRRAGSSHADVQPLTFNDTKVMKSIYGGRWSWKRRAVLINTQNRLIAASMHGMPHGAGALRNGFPGHFCIHFKGSTTHKTGTPDLSHLLMIMKAGGRLDSFLNELEPQPLLEAFLAGVKNSDKTLVKKTLTSTKVPEDLINRVEALKWEIGSLKNEAGEPLVATIDVKLQLFIKETGPLNTSVTFTLIRTSPTAPWKVDGRPLYKLLK